jgi:NAD(P)-dependent dehydrogenase (short-subunit alcohol dehydrogenase family)
MAPPSAIVTGASSGIGLAITRRLAADGFAVTLVARGQKRLDTVTDELRRAGYEVAAVAADVCDEDDIQRVLRAHGERHGSLDVLVNNAGMGVFGPILEAVNGQMDLQYKINLRSVMLFYRDALELLRRAAQDHGHALVVNTASITGKRGEANLGVYSAVKHGVVGLTQAMNQELHPYRIKSCVLCPGYVDTPLADYKKSEVPAETMIHPDDIAAAVHFLTRLSTYCVVPEVLFQRFGDPV